MRGTAGGGILPNGDGFERVCPRLANRLQVERYYRPDRKSILAALRVVLGLPKAPPGWMEELRR